MRIGLMGFGRIGRQLYSLACRDPRFDIVAISDIGNPSILCHLFHREHGQQVPCELKGNYLVQNGAKTRMLSAALPGEIPWDLFDVDLVVDATSRFLERETLTPHLENGALRVVLSTFPQTELDRMIVLGVNHEEARASDRLVSAGSATTSAMALALKTVTEHFQIEHATVTSIHAYTSDQTLQDTAGPDYRRSRSGAENIIPNVTFAPHWTEQVLPSVSGKVSGYALNVPVKSGSLMDLSIAMSDSSVSAQDIARAFEQAATEKPDLYAITEDPIVSSDVCGVTQSLLVDKQGIMKAGANLIKVLIWHEILGHACRILDVAKLYDDLDKDKG